MASVVDGRLLASGEAVRLHWEEGRISEIQLLDTGAALPLLAPGLIDVQVNGFAGIDYNSEGLTLEKLQESARALWQEGTTSFLPTLISNSPTATTRLLHNLQRSSVGLVHSSILGYHLEGPWISAEDGPRGAHDAAHVQHPTLEYWSEWQRAAEGAIKLVTLSPEWPGVEGVIRELVWQGVRLAIGHTAASPEQIAQAARAGASLSTHLGNGCHLSLPRHRNYLWSQLADDRLWASVIADGFHLPCELLRVFLRVKGQRLLVTSDATAFAGMEPGDYQTPVGGRVRLTPSGKLHLADNQQLLAGSAKSQFFALGFLVSAGLASLADAWSLAAAHPACYLGLHDRGEIAVGKRADFVLLSPSEHRVLATWLAGQCVYKN